MGNQEAKIYEFGPFKLSESRRQLLRDGSVVPLQPKTLQLLFILLENPGRTVPKEKIIAAIWPDRVVEENNLSQRIYHLRRVLSEHKETANCIHTVSGGGYLFDSIVKISTDPSILDQAMGESTANQGGNQEYITAIDEDESEELPEETVRPRLLSERLLKKRFWIAGIGVLLMIAIGAGLAVTDLSSLKMPWSTPKEPRISPMTTSPGLKSFPSFSPDGKFVAFTWDGDSLHNNDIYVKMVNQGEVLRVTSNAKFDTQPVWSPDSTKLAFLRAPDVAEERFRLMVVPALGGTETEVARVWGGLAWSPDGKWFAVSDNEAPGTSTGMYLISTDGGERRAISKPGPGFSVFDTFPAFSPDGKRLAFVRWVSDISGDVFIADIESGSIRQVTNDQKSVRTPQWTADGREIIFVSNRNGNNRAWRVGLSGGAPVLVEAVPNEVENISLSPNSNQIVYTQYLDDTAIEVARLQSPQPPCTINSTLEDTTPRLSPDGTQIVFDSRRTGKNELWIAQTDCSHQKQLTNGLTLGGSPRWSMDSTQIAFSVYIDAQSEIVVINTNGTGYRRMTNHPGADVTPAWSKDGNWLYFSSNRQGNYQIYRMPVGGGEAVQITKNGGFEPIESADGTMLYYSRNEKMRQKNLQTGEESEIPELKNVHSSRQWDVGTHGLYYIPVEQKERLKVQRLDLKTRIITEVREIRGFLPSWTPGISVSRDEQWIATAFTSYRVSDVMLLDSWR